MRYVAKRFPTRLRVASRDGYHAGARAGVLSGGMRLTVAIGSGLPLWCFSERPSPLRNHRRRAGGGGGRHGRCFGGGCRGRRHDYGLFVEPISASLSVRHFCRGQDGKRRCSGPKILCRGSSTNDRKNIALVQFVP